MRTRRLALACALAAPALVVAPALAAPSPEDDPVPVTPQVREVPLDPAAPLPATALPSRGTGTKEAPGGRADQQDVLSAPLDVGSSEVLGVTWAPGPGADDVHVGARSRTAGGAWTPWAEVGADAGEGPDPVAPDTAEEEGRQQRPGSVPVWVSGAAQVQVRVSAHEGPAPSDVRVALVDPGDSPADDDAAAPRASSASAATTRPEIRSRARWGADESLRGRLVYDDTVSAVAIHHTATPNGYAQADVPRLLRGIYGYHVRSRGWSDIGYHVLVDRFGTAWEGRAGGLDRPVRGTHAGGFNTRTSSVSLLGSFDGGAPPPAAALDAVAGVVAWKLSLHDRDPRGSVTLTSAGSSRFRAGREVTLGSVFGHRDVSSTACPGRLAYATLEQVRDRAARLVGASAASADLPSAERGGEATPEASRRVQHAG